MSTSWGCWPTRRATSFPALSRNRKVGTRSTPCSAAAAYYNLGNFPDAAAGYRKLVEEYPGGLDYQTGLGWALLRLGKREEAQKIFQFVVSVSPDNPNAQEGIAAK